ncbi:MAG TPA: HAMP domain-containing sensor histidine kinase [Ktedonobacterales bacterium]|nr:HAMP domain-containing sensor histidine kinase [Ktedonobacterales bacterium]
MSASAPKPPTETSPESLEEHRPFEMRHPRLAPGILSRRILRQDDLSPLQWWHRRGIGYPITIVLVTVITFLALQFFQILEPEPHFFAGALMILLVFIIALVWGAGPAIFATLLSTVALDYFIVSPVSRLDRLSDLEDFVPFIVASLILSLLTSQRESARRRARTAERLATERTAALEEAGKLKDQFLSLASHELKTPISAIKGYAQLAQRRLGKVSGVSPNLAVTQEMLLKINQQTDKLTNLVNDLLDVSRIQAGKLELRLETCDLAALCRQAAEEQEMTSGRRIEVSLRDAPVFIRADAERLAQVLSNLLNNAVKYSDADRPVYLTLACQAQKALLTVEDEGVGIPQDELSLIFDRFFRASTARSGPQRGLGLGLAICKEIIERHHGQIWATSEEGKGSRFTVMLPLAEMPQAERSAS